MSYRLFWVWQGRCYTVEFRYSETDARPIHTACGLMSKAAAIAYAEDYIK